MMLMVVAALAAGLLQEVPDTPPDGTPSAAQFAAARDALDKQLFDYPSARFRDVRADSFRICGMVNAKNRMGAYIGWKQFGFMGDEPSSLLWVDDPYMLEPFCTPSLMATERDYSDRMTPTAGK